MIGCCGLCGLPMFRDADYWAQPIDSPPLGLAHRACAYYGEEMAG